MWACNGGPEPPGVDTLLNGQPRPVVPVWKGDLAPADNGVVILVTPIGTKEFVARILEQRLEHQKHLLRVLPRVPHLQSVWLLLPHCAVPRANHLVRSFPPDIVRDFAEAHDKSILSTFQQLIGYPQADDDPYLAKAKHIAFLPIVRGGLGLRSMALIASAAYWAARADILPTIAERRPA